MDAQLPVPNTADCGSSCEAIVLEVLPRGQYALNRRLFAASELRQRIQHAFVGRPTSILFVKGHPQVRYQDVVTAMDVARGAGVKVLAIAAKEMQ